MDLMRLAPVLVLAGSLFLLPGRAGAQKLPAVGPAPAVFVQPNQPAEAPEDDQHILQKAKVPSDGPELLEFFRKRTLVKADRKQLEALVRQLGDDEFAVREKASAALVKLGARALPVLREAEKTGDDPEVLERAQRCRVLIEGVAGAQVSAAAARLVARKKPAGAAEVLLAYLPFAEDDTVAEELRSALAAVGVRDGKPEPALVKALEDKLPAKRAAAADVLCRAGVKAELPAVHKLLQDRDAHVRLRAALGLVPHNDKEAVSTLIRLLGELNEDEAWPAADLLARLAGEQSPAVSLGTDAESRKHCQEAWARWWQQNQAKVDLAHAARPPALRGYTLIVQRDLVFVKGGGAKGGRAMSAGKVFELGADKKVRWQIQNLDYPVDAQVLPGDRVLIAEWQGSKVTERTFNGEVKWTKALPGRPLSAQRLANGNTFIAMQNQLLEVDKDGKEVWSYRWPTFDVLRARKLGNGDIAVVTNQGVFFRLDSKAKQVRKSFHVGFVQQFGTLEVLANGRVLVAQANLNRVVEFNQDGRIVWQANTVQWPTSATRLPNGQTLVSSQNTNQVVVLDRKGKVVWQYGSDGQVIVARRR
jgi:outer membrane protein assembly factor BamB/HEAT repeat protein